MFRSGYVYFIGRPNVGKSSVINRLMGEKLTIVSDKPQTTRNAIQFIDTDEFGQLIYVDTPGIQIPKNKLGEFLLSVSEKSLNEADVICYVVEPELKLGRLDNLIMELIKSSKKVPPVILAINKIDTAKNTEEVFKVFEGVSFCAVIGLSAKDGTGIEKLKSEIRELLPEGPRYYPSDMITDRSERFIVSEIIREKALELLEEEIPHGIAVGIENFKEGNSTSIEAVIYCEKESHKGMIIGKEAQKIKEIGIRARVDIEKFLDKKTHLKLWVKTAKNWRNKAERLSAFGYRDDQR